MQFGIKVANYPLIPEDFERGSLPDALLPLRDKLFGLSIKPGASPKSAMSAAPTAATQASRTAVRKSPTPKA